jgi:hypothetical protein
MRDTTIQTMEQVMGSGPALVIIVTKAMIPVTTTMMDKGRGIPQDSSI